MAIINSTEYPVGTVYKYNNTILQVSYVDNPCGESDYCKIQIVKEIFVMQYRMNVIIKELTVVVFYVQIEKIIYVL